MSRDSQAELLKAVEGLASTLAPDVIDDLADGIRGLASPEGAADLARQAATPIQRQLMGRLHAAWVSHGEIEPAALAWALRAAELAVRGERESESLELVWTGPSPQGAAMRRTDQALMDVIDGAGTSLTIATYVAYEVPNVADSLANARRRGVRVRLVLESEHESRQDPFEALQRAVPDAELYRWPTEQRQDQRGSMHVKCAVADAQVAFISSANLTGYAMERNMELGVLIRGGALPKRIEEHFDGLVREGVLERQEV